ncbi:MAG: hypothetical protein J6X02_01795 [Bacilli bacterium]|nr:hypothetical protein [Bacilli bacterium]
MDQEKNDMLRSDLMEAKCMFDNLIFEMQEKSISFPYEEVIKMTEISYANAYNAITRMNDYTKDYEFLNEANEDFYEDEARLIFSGIIMYLISLVVMRIFGKILSGKQINEIYYLLAGFLLGSVNTGIIFNNINEHRYGNKDSREFINRIKTLKDDYKKDYHIAYNEIESINSLNRNLHRELERNINQLSI